MSDALTPAGAGDDRVITSWVQLARHADTPCEWCLPLVEHVRGCSMAPTELLVQCCQAGQALLDAWTEARSDLVDHLIALQ